MTFYAVGLKKLTDNLKISPPCELGGEGSDEN